MAQAATLTFHVNSRSRGASRGKQQGLGKFCSICKSAGKSVEEYTSHFVRENRDPNSRVVCPVILESTCNYCGKKGHLKSHCHLLKKRNQKRSADSATAKTFRPDRKSKTFQDVATFRVDTRISKVTRQDREWQQKHQISSDASSVSSSTAGRFAVLHDASDDELDTVRDTQRMPSIGSKPLPAPLPYGKMMKRVAVAQEPPKTETFAVKPAKKSVTFVLPKIVQKPVEKPVEKPAEKPETKIMEAPAVFNFTDDFADLDWADEAEENCDDVTVETPAWAMSAEEKATKQKESISALQAEIADGWDD